MRFCRKFYLQNLKKGPLIKMVKNYEPSELKGMSFAELRAHAKALQKAGYPINKQDYRDAEDTGTSKKFLRKRIRHAQKDGPSGKSRGKSPSLYIKQLKSGLECGMIKNQCLKNTVKYSIQDIKELSASCGIEYTTRKQTCAALATKYGSGSSSPKKTVGKRRGRSRSVSPKKRKASRSRSPPKKGRKNELMALLKTELIAMTKGMGLPYSNKNKDALADAIINAEKSGAKKRSKSRSKSPKKRASPKKRSKSRSPKRAAPKKRSKSRSNSKSKSKSPKRAAKKRSKSKSPKRASPKKRSKSRSKSKSPKKRSKSRSKSKSPKKRSKSSSSSKASSGLKSCGEFDYEELINMRLKELKKILNAKGFDASNVSNERDAADYICAVESNGECGEENDYQCLGNSVCDVSVGDPGICVDHGSEQVANITFNDQKIIGSKNAIRALRKKLGLTRSGSYREDIPDKFSEAGFLRSKLINQAALVSGNSKETFATWPNSRLKKFIEGAPIREERGGKIDLINQISYATGQSPGFFSDWSLKELRERAQTLQDFARHKEFNRDNLIETLATWTGRSYTEFQDMSHSELRKHLRKLTDADLAPELNRDNLIESLAKWTGRPHTEFQDMSYSELRKHLRKLTDWDEDKKEYVIQELVSRTGRDPSFYEGWPMTALKQQLGNLQSKYSDPSGTSSEEEPEEVIAAIEKAASSSSEEEVPVVVSSLSEEEIQVIPVAKSSSSSEEEVRVVPIAKSSSSSEEAVAEVDVADVEAALTNIMDGKPGEIENISQVQTAVLKCLGLIS